MENLNLFGSLLIEDTKWLQENGSQEVVNGGEALIINNVSQLNIYFVIKGIFKVLVDSKSPIPIAILGPGEIIGESSLIDKESSSAIVVAVDKSLVLKIDGKVIMQHIDKNPTFGLRLYKGLYKITVERLRNTNRQLSHSYI